MAFAKYPISGGGGGGSGWDGTTALNATVNGADSTPALKFSGTWFTGGTATTTKPQFLLEPAGTTSTSWSTSGTGLGINAPSGFTGNLLDLQVNGASKFKVEATVFTFLGHEFRTDANALVLTSSAGTRSLITRSDFSLIPQTAFLGWGNLSSFASDLKLYRDAAGILAQRNGTNAQTYRLYNTYTDASNYERVAFKWDTNTFKIEPEAAGTGTLRSLEFSANGAASTPPVNLTGTWFSGGTSTTTKPQLLIEPAGTTSTSWNTSGTGLGVNAASGFTGNLLDLQVGGTTRLLMNASYFQVNGITGSVRIDGSVKVRADKSFQWSASNNIDVAADLLLLRDAAGILAQRNGANAQTYRLYNTYTNSSNYQRTSMTDDSTGLVIDQQYAGTGGARTNLIELKDNGTSKLAVVAGAGSSSVTTTELGYLSGVTSSIQTQLTGKANLSGATFTGPISVTGYVTLTSGGFAANYTWWRSGTSLFMQYNSAASFQLQDSAASVALLAGPTGYLNIGSSATTGGNHSLTIGISSFPVARFQNAADTESRISFQIAGSTTVGGVGADNANCFVAFSASAVNNGQATNAGAWTFGPTGFSGTHTARGSFAITATSSQLVLGTTNTTTISATAPSASRVYTIPDAGGNADFVLTAGAQTIAGATTFSDDLTVDSAFFVDQSAAAVVVGASSGPVGALTVNGASTALQSFKIAGTTAFRINATATNVFKFQNAAGSSDYMTIDTGAVTLGPSTFTGNSIAYGGLVVGATNATTIGTEGTFLGGSGSTEGYIKACRDGAVVIAVNRLTSDGELVAFYQAGTQEGSITVSGTTVTYGGGHLARWSQFEDKSTPPIYRGTLMSSTGVMATWDGEANEQLTCSKVSDVPGDKTVSGIFQEYDHNDDPESVDFWLAQTGDYIIRIAQGVTVQVGDLLESAGDGTARPQADDIVRASTVAKVMSSNASITYDDGSYCVPCLLML